MLHVRLSKLVSDNHLLQSCEIGFRWVFSIWFPHVDLNRIRLAKESGHVWTLDIRKAYYSVEHSAMVDKFVACNVPTHAISWIQKFWSSRLFFTLTGSIIREMYTQTRGISQGSVLLPLLFSTLISFIPTISGVSTYVYANDMAFFALALDVQSLYDTLNLNLNHEN